MADTSTAQLEKLEAEHAKRIAALQDIEAQLSALRAANRDAKRAELKKQIADYGFTAADLFEQTKPKPKRKPRTANKAKEGEAAKPTAEAKYRNPTTGETWGGGRGRKPAWVVEATAKGVDIETFRIPSDPSNVAAETPPKTA
jgi:DNA-binding protein H-NS